MTATTRSAFDVITIVKGEEYRSNGFRFRHSGYPTYGHRECVAGGGHNG